MNRKKHYNVKMIYYPETEECEVQIFNTPILSPDEHIDRQPVEPDDEEIRAAREKRNQERNMRRAKKRIFKLARANKWQFWVTLTLDPQKIDRTNYDRCVKKVRNVIKSAVRRYGAELRYLIVPDCHEDGCWHFHGLMSGLGDLADSGRRRCMGRHDGGELKQAKYYKTEEVPAGIEKVQMVWNWTKFTLGWSTIVELGEEDSAKTSNYLCNDHLFKGMSALPKGRKRYFYSKNLNVPEERELMLRPEEAQELFFSLGDVMTHQKAVTVKKNGKIHNRILYAQFKGLVQ